MEQITTELLCRMPTGSADVGLSGSGDPTGSVTPDFVDQLYHDTTGDVYYRSTGLTSADWTAISGASRGGETFGLFSYGDSGATGDIVINDTVCIPGYDIESEPNITSLSFPNLTAIDPENLQGGYFTLFLQGITEINLPLLTIIGGSFDPGQSANVANVSVPELITIGRNITMNGMNALTSLVFPKLVSVGRSILLEGCAILESFSCPLLTTTLCSGADVQIVADSSTALTTVNLPEWLPTNDKDIIFQNCALSETSVDHILARCVANPAYVSGIINLSGGTNSPPSAAGLVNKGILEGRGATVLVNS